MLVNGQWSPKLAKNFLEFLWFMPYARVSRGPKESCGFRHVFEHDVIRQVSISLDFYRKQQNISIYDCNFFQNKTL